MSYSAHIPPRQQDEPPCLSDLRPGERGHVISIDQACQGTERRRMMDLGIVPGTLIAVEMTSPGGDPTAYRVRGALIALRQEQARCIRITQHQGVARL